jgi:hypothetical protein
VYLSRERFAEPNQLRLNMNRHKFGLAAVGSLALFVAILALLPAPDDGIEWMRRYGARETLHPGAPWQVGGNVYQTQWHKFSFDRIPPKMLDEIAKRSEYHAEGDSFHFNGTFPDTDRIIVDRNANTVEVYVRNKEKWVDREWNRLRGLVCLR